MPAAPPHAAQRQPPPLYAVLGITRDVSCSIQDMSMIFARHCCARSDMSAALSWGLHALRMRHFHRRFATASPPLFLAAAAQLAALLGGCALPAFRDFASYILLLEVLRRAS